MRFFPAAGLLLCLLSAASAQNLASTVPVDSDHDGLSDAVENALLSKFAPRFMVSKDDCSVLPAIFVPFRTQPIVLYENGTIYGQAFPRPDNANEVELHYYHLWRRDCGEMSHDLDAEHVSALVVRDSSSNWKALYWYAAAHEETLCDSSQIARAASVDGELQGPQVWISRGKHASFLSNSICTRSCGGDDCSAMESLTISKLVNLGELSNPMNGTIWAGSTEWPLSNKMGRSDFSETRTGRVDDLANTGILWANPGKRPIQAAILGGNDALGGAETGFRSTDTALDLASFDTGEALNTASSSTAGSLGRSIGRIKKALRLTTRKVGGAVGIR